VMARDIAERAAHVSGMQKTEELFPLVSYLLLDPPRRVVEIGSAAGGSFLAWCLAAAHDAVLVSVDIAHEEEDRMRGYGRKDQTVHLVTGDSHDPETRRQVQDIVGNTVDLLFIDAAHFDEDVRADFEDYSPLVRPGGLVVFHDIADQGPIAQLWSELVDRYPSFKFVEDENDPWGGIGVLKI
jgi:predicted O-methyltransferase YrrM